MHTLITDRTLIKALAEVNEEENDAFRELLQRADGDELDATVQRLNESVASMIDCTDCGACCRQLMINVTPEENTAVAGHLGCSAEDFKKDHLEESLQGKLIMKSIPCNFLHHSKCTIYTERFNECRQFPHLHEKNFKGRLFGTLVHYAMCPIIYNVVEELKIETGFKEAEFGDT